MAPKLAYKELEKEAFLRKQIEKALRASEKRCRAMFESTQEAIIAADSDGTIISANPATAKILGFKKPEDLIGHPATTIYADIKQREMLFAELFEKGFVKNYEVTFKKTDGKMVHALGTATLYRDEQGSFDRVEGFFSDISDHKRAEAELRESEGNFRAVAENANDGIVILKSGGKACFANKRACEITGYCHTELSKIGFKELVHPDELDYVKQRYRIRMAGDTNPATFESRIVHKQGAVVPVEISGSKTFWKERPVVLAIIRDITQRRQMEAELLEARDELERRVEERTLELTETADQLERKHKELLHHKNELEKVNQELVDTNKALSVLARNIDQKREEVQKQTAMTVTSKILPIIEEFQKDQTFAKHQAELDIMCAYLNELIPAMQNGAGIIFSLSAAELRIAAMIKSGLNSQQIADTLHVSLDTIKTHRKNIRKKLNISNSQVNLATYLRAKMG